MTDHSLDDILALLSHSHRRRSLQYLRDQSSDAVSLAELADHLAAMAADSTTDPASVQKQIRAELHHSHLPKLSKLAAVEYEPENRTVRYSPEPPIEEALDRIPTDLDSIPC